MNQAKLIRTVAFLVCVPPLSAQSPGTFTATGSMAAPRTFHTATLLISGKVLIAGGAVSAQTLATADTAELYDPASGTFAVTGDMGTARAGHTATLLPDGRVLVAGGIIDSPLNSAEIYDPSTGTFSPTGNMISAHTYHQAILLGNGKVLIAGGSGGSLDVVPAAELFDLASGTFSPAGPYTSSPSSPNTGQAAVSSLLPDGRVLILWESGAAELYDPTAGSFTPTGASIGKSYSESLPTATLLLNGKVLVAGGEDESGNRSSAELYDPSTGAFTATGSLTTPRAEQTATLLPDGSALMAGSDIHNVLLLASAEVYDPVSGVFTPTGNMVVPRAIRTATLLNNGKVLMAGGGSTAADSSTAELYNPPVLIPAPALFSLAGNGQGQGAIWNATTGQIASSQNPAAAGDFLSMYTTSLAEGGVIPPQVEVGGQLAEIVFFGDAPGYPGYFQINFQVPVGVTPGPSVPVVLTYLGRPSNAVSISVQ